MSVGAREFRDVLGRFAAGVTVVTTRDAAGRPLGLTVTAFASVSLDPPLVLVCVDNRSEANAGFRDSGLFGVSMLAEDQELISQRFAAGGPAKFEGLPLQAGQTGVLLVPGALAHVECRVTAVHPGGDHTIYVGEVMALAAWPGRPLVHQGSAYRRLICEPERKP
jgi:3-hydroxy-9,10-secoandrosta-1,3,5(10)-triene-9,17-dione monooxygenase reductase component